MKLETEHLTRTFLTSRILKLLSFQRIMHKINNKNNTKIKHKIYP